MSNSSKMIWPYPNKDSDPWFDTFESMVFAMDSSGYASREDRSIILSEGGLVSFDATTGVLAWSAAIVLLSPIAGFKLIIPAGSVTLQDGQTFYVNLTRAPQGNITLTPFVAGQIPNSDNAMAMAIRSGSAVYWRNGARILSGESKSLFSSGLSTGLKLVDTVRLANRESHDAVTPLVVGGDAFDPTVYTNPGFSRVLTFRAVVANGDVGITTSVSLYSLSDNDLIATLSFSSTTPTRAQVVLVEGTGAGQIDPAVKLYEVRISLNAPPGGPTETIELYGADISVVSTAS